MIEYNGPEWYAPFAAVAVGVAVLLLMHGTAKWLECGVRLPRLRRGLYTLGQARRNFVIWREIDRKRQDDDE